MIDPERVVVTVEGGVADVRLVHADKRNALDRRMFQAIIEAGEQDRGRSFGVVVVLSGDGKAFCAGLDTSLFAAIAEHDEGSTATTSTTTGIRTEAVQAVRVWVDMAPPVIAAVHGVAVGAGSNSRSAPTCASSPPMRRSACSRSSGGSSPTCAARSSCRAWSDPTWRRTSCSRAGSSPEPRRRRSVSRPASATTRAPMRSTSPARSPPAAPTRSR